MLKISAVQMAVICLLLFAFRNASAQGKIELPASSSPPHGFVLFKGNNIANYPFQLPAKSDLMLNDGSVKLQASVKNHLLHGFWKSYYHSEQLIDMGMLVKGVPDGLWQSWYPNGQLKSVRNYSSDLLERVLEDVLLNHPKLSRFIITERVKKEGRHVLFVLRSSYSYNNNSYKVPSSILELVQSNSFHPSAYHPPFIQSLHHGLYMNYFENGIVKDSGHYKEGLREGLWVQRNNSSGGKWMGMYKHGNRQKEWKYYNTAERLQLIVFFNKKGEEVWRKTFY
jgi:antitoxin component YwqK of YwqJK toxin-antitoxin module